MSDTGAVPGRDVTAGVLLREAREAAGLHVATLAATLKVPVRKLEALEQDRYEELPDSVFVRALASSVCRTLKVDPQPVLERLPQNPQPKLADKGGINEPFRPPAGHAPKSGWRNQFSRPVALTVVVLLLGAVVLVFLPVREPAAPQGAVTDAAPPAVITAPAEPRGEPGAAAALTPAQPPSTRLGLTSAAPPGPSAPSAAAPAAAPPPPAAIAPVAVATPAAPASAATAAASAAAIAARGIVTFRAKGSSWVQVTDANGSPVLRKLLQSGETAGASGALPLSVTVGSVEQMEVQVRGKPFDLARVSRDNVARFEVK